MPQEPVQPVGKLTKITPSSEPKQPVGKLTPIGKMDLPAPKEYGITDSQQPDQLENTLQDIKKTARGPILDSEIDILRDVLKNPSTTSDQAKEAVQTIQGYHPKFTEGKSTAYYLKKEDNGVTVPKALSYGERPPKGYDVASVWGNPKQANDDSWYTDLGKSLYNGVVGAAKGAAQLGNLASIGITGEESNALNSTTNALESLQFKKDEKLNAPIYDTQGINEWGDLIDKDRFNFSPKALWGTLNMAVESATEFMTGAAGTAKAIKGVSGASELGKAGVNASAFTGSFLMNAKDNIENAKDAGLEGRDIFAFALPVSAGQAAIDAKWGITSNLYKNVFSKSEKEVIKQFAKDLPKTAAGELTEEGFKELVKGTVLAYDKVVGNAVTRGVTNMFKEGAQEAGQDFVQKSGEELYDKLSPEERAKFGTHATDAKSFGSYMQNFAAGLIGTGPMAFLGNAEDYKEQHDKQSVDAMKIVEGGKDKMDEFKANLFAAHRRGDITETERDRAVFKVDQYDKYWQQTKDLPNMGKDDRRKAFELSFNIEGLKNEIPQDLEGLDPIAIAKVKNKEKMIKDLQLELNHILLKQEVATEPVVGQKTVDEVAKNEGLDKKEGEKPKKRMTIDELLKQLDVRTEEADKIEFTKENKPETDNEVDFEVDNHKSMVRRPIPKFTTLGWNKMSYHNPLRAKAIVQEHLKTQPNHEMDVTIRSGKNEVLTADIGDNKQIRFAQSRKSTDPAADNFLKHENLPDNKVKIDDRGGDTDPDNEGEPEFYYEQPVKLKRVDFPSVNKEGKPMNKAVLVAYNPKKGFIGFIREHKVGKSSHYTNKDKQHLQDIINANWITEPQEAAQQVAAPSVKEFADKIANGQLENTPDEQQYYENNKEAIEAELQSRVEFQKPAEKTKSKPAKTPQADSVKEFLNFVYKNPPSTFEEAVIRFFLSNNRISVKDFKRYMGFGEKNERTGKTKGRKEFNSYIWAFSKNGRSIDNIVSTLWNEDLEKEGADFDEQSLINEFFDVLSSHGGKRSLVDRLIDIKKNESESEQYASPEQMREAQEAEEAEKYLNTRDLTDAEIEEELSKAEARNKFEASGITQYQKQRNVKGDAFKVIERLKKIAPKVNWVYDNKLKAAAQVKGNAITVNPFYAGIDTPIHEIGHILIDAMGYENKVIQAAIKQLQDTDLWAETKERYPELSDEQLGKEVLAEAIGREGAGIFNDTVAKSRFKQILDYIYDWLKRKLGLDKNIAKSLAKQIMAGVGTEGLKGTNQEVQYAKRSEHTQGADVQKLIDKINSIEDISILPYEELVDYYNFVSNADIGKAQHDTAMSTIMKRMALNLKERSLDADKKKALSNEIKHKDITWLNIFMKVLSHFDETFPEMQGLSKMYDAAVFKALESAEKQKYTHRKLAENVIKDYNKKLGIIQRVGFWAVEKVFDQKHKYFGFLDNGKGKLITSNEANNLNDAQKEYLKFVRETLAKRKGIDILSDVYDTDMDVLKIGKSTGETFQTEGFVSAVASVMSNDALGQVKIEFTNPKTGKKQITEFKNVRSILSSYAKGGTIKDKTKAMIAVAEYTVKAKSQLKKGYHADGTTENFPQKIQGKPTLSEDGQLKSRFDEDSYKGNSYSKDFFTAMNLFIDDTSHIENVSPLIPIINSIEYLAKNGIVDENGVKEHYKPNLALFMEKWEKHHIFKSPDRRPGIDEVLKFLRKLTSASTMMFNISAQGMNVAVGQYSNFVELPTKTFAKGLKRLFAGNSRGLDPDNAFGLVNKKMIDIARKYKAISIDLDSNPIRSGWGIFSSAGYALLKWGEVLNQVGALGGLLDDKDYDSFEYKTNEHGVKELVVKDSLSDKEKKELEERILSHINKVSDIHGKYSEKDRRNIMNSEFGKAVMQYRVWVPDVWRMRFGENGRWTTAGKTAWKLLFKEGREQMSQAIRDDGGAVKHFWKDEVFMKNLKGAIITASLLTLTMDDDDDHKVLDRFLSEVLFIFDPNNLKFTITHPIPAAGTIEKFLTAVDHVIMNEADDFYKGKGKYGDKGDPKFIGDIISMSPGKKAIDIYNTVNDEE